MLDKAPSFWRETTMREVVELFASGDPFLKLEYSDAGIPVLAKGDVKPFGRLKHSEKRFMDEKLVKKRNYRITRSGDYLLTTRDLTQDANFLGLLSLIPEIQRYLVNQGANVVRFTTRVDGRYLVYWCNGPVYRRYIKSHYVGSTQIHIRKDDFLNAPLWLPELDEQKAIANVLGALDSQIELYQQMSKTHEAIGQAVFKHWFIDFEFPDEAGNPYKSAQGAMVSDDRIDDPFPEHWTVISNISEICDKINYGYTQQASEDNIGPKFLRVTDINKGDWINWETVPYCEIEGKDLEKYLLSKGDIVIARMADPGKVAIFEHDLQAVFASYLIRIRLKDPSFAYYLYYLMKSEYYQDYILGAAGGSVQKNLNAKGLTNGLPILVPPKPLVERFSHVVEVLRARTNRSIAESGALGAIRDALLPKLMSGKIRVPLETK